MKRDNVLDNSLLDEETTNCAASDEGSDETSGESPDRSATAQNADDSGAPEEGTGADVELLPRDEDEKSPSKSGEQRKAARKTSKKELLGLIKQKNDLLNRMGDEIEKQKQELKNKEDKLLRIAAEFENYKKRTRREWELLEKRAKAELITDILGVLDDFDRALEALGEREDDVADGVKLIVNGLKDLLRRVGVEEVDAFEHRFDPQFHEAVGETPSDTVAEGSVAHVVQKGYRLNDMLLRPAKVIVSKKK